jgi:hypothetical protein
MGYGHYSYEAHARATDARAARAAPELFLQRSCHPSMSPLQAVRESRDSAAHPNSVGVIFALDVSGSMGEVPRTLATETLPGFMRCVTGFLPDAQLLFAAVGNAYADASPLQIGQFESEDAKIDAWLERLHLEGGGGGLGESYDLAMLFAARMTRVDGSEKRRHRGYLFLTGDEPPFGTVGPEIVKQVLGLPLDAPLAIHDLITEVCHTWHLFFLIPDASRAAQYETGEVWRQLLGPRAVVLASPDDTAIAAALLIGVTEGHLSDAAALAMTARTHLAASPDMDARAERIAGAVTPYLQAFLSGPLAGPAVLPTRHVEGVKG